MGLEMRVAAEEVEAAPAAAPSAAGEPVGVEIYPLSRYYFGAREAAGGDGGGGRESATGADRELRLKANFAAHGLRTSVHGVLLVELFDHPHVLLLQVRNSSFLLPGGRLRPGEQDVRGLKRKLSSKLSIVGDQDDEVEVDEWQIGERIGMWWRSEFDAVPFPYLLPNARAPKECIKLFLIKLPVSRQFVVPRNMKLLAVPLSQIHNNAQVYGPIIAGIPNLLSKFSFNFIND
ncbi:hypothetical protein ABZP36_025991 [Zizania latifolia]